MGGNTSKEAEEKAKIKKDKQEREAAINKQRYYEAFEIRQDWNFVFGLEKPKKKKDVLVIKDITPRNVWFEKSYIFEKIKEHQPDELFHPIEHYALKWTTPGAQHQYMVPLDDPALQEMVIIRISYIPKKLQKRLLFFFAPRSLNMEMFAPKVHPASLVSYRLRSEVLQKLCAQYLEGRLSVEDFEAIVGSTYDVWKSAVFNLLPEDEQVYHTYLTEKPEMVRTLKQVEQDYLDNRVPLQEYCDAKFPDRKKKKDAEALDYPRPYPTGECIICGDPNLGIIKCHVCINKVCVACVQKTFLDPETREGSFLLIHRRQCLKLPLLRALHPVSVLEPAYLRELRATGQGHAMEVLGPLLHGKMAVAEEEAAEEEDEVDEEEIRREEERKRKEAEAELQARLRECPPELEHLRHALTNRHKKADKLQKEILGHQANLDEPGHTEQYEGRQRRLRDELVAKLLEGVHHPVGVIARSVDALALTESLTARDMEEEFSLLVARCEALRDMASVEDFDARMTAHAVAVDEAKNARMAQIAREAHEAMMSAAKGAFGGAGKKKKSSPSSPPPPSTSEDVNESEGKTDSDPSISISKE